jgi:ribonuclease HII
MPTLILEQQIRFNTGFTRVAGLDEAGRGAIAGPVVAAAVILPLDQPRRIAELRNVNDSKQLSPKFRAELFDLVIEHSLTYGIGYVAAEEIDQLGIIPANAKAMEDAISQLQPEPQYLILDGRMRLRNLLLPQQSIIRGDSSSLTIAAASILAKVSRDNLMIELDQHYPDYLFASHKGYCTVKHVAALEQHGPCPLHRHSFSPIRQSLF